MPTTATGDSAPVTADHPGSPDHQSHSSPTGSAAKAALAVGALGVVFGDIGTSPLYAMQTVFSLDGGFVAPNRPDVYGVVSMIVWSITIIVSIKYVLFILRADNEGEGGVLSLAFLTRRSVRVGGRRFKLVMLLGVIGASLFYGDSLITPAISVLSAVEGLNVVSPGLSQYVLPIGAVIITALFAAQKVGTEWVGRFFGPVMVLWFVTLAGLGIPHLIEYPQAIFALSPTYALDFVIRHPMMAFVAFGGVVLSITGAEALYADMGHFGRNPIRQAWFWLVFPSLTINYLGQAELIVRDPSTAAKPFFELAPSWLTLPLVVLATMATVIASQSVISGAFSVSRQAERLGFLPRLTVRQTSEHEGGQIYLPGINWLLYAGVLILMLTFRASERLAAAYGLAVTATLLLTTVLFMVYAEAALGWKRWQLAAVALSFGTIEEMFFLANIPKLPHGGWLPVVIAVLIATVMLTWRQGQNLVVARRRKLEGSLAEFVDEVRAGAWPRVHGSAVYLHVESDTAPLALRENVSFNKVLHEQVVITQTIYTNRPHVDDADRVKVEELDVRRTRGGNRYGPGVYLVKIRFGFADDQDIPAALAVAVENGLPIDLDETVYFLSRITVHRSTRPGMMQWRKRIYTALSHNAADATQYFRLPIGRTIVVGAQVFF